MMSPLWSGIIEMARPVKQSVDAALRYASYLQRKQCGMWSVYERGIITQVGIWNILMARAQARS